MPFFACLFVLTPFDDCFCVDVLIHFVSSISQVPVSISRNLVFSVSLGLLKIQLFDLAYIMAD